MGPEERSKRLRELCGAGSEFEVSKAVAPKLKSMYLTPGSLPLPKGGQ